MRKKASNEPNLTSFQFALLRTFDAGNIGSSLRAITTMGFSKLWVINPLHYDEEMVKKMAAGAKDRYDCIERCDTLEDVVSQADLVLAFSARGRLDYPHVSLQAACDELVQTPVERVVLLFGNETNGLHNDELRYAQKTVYIPTDSDKSSLNLAHAVMIVAYELRKTFQASPPIVHHGVSVTQKEMLFELFYSLMASLFYQKEMTAEKTRLRLFNAFKKWPLNQSEFTVVRSVLHNAVGTLKSRTLKSDDKSRE
jgi:TrmH family RNA methyltransferase